MKQAAVVPCARPEARHRLEALVAAHPEVQFVVVTNGRARGAFSGSSAAVLESDDSAGAARNRGLDWVREQGFDVVSFLDDDDYYGPGYFLEARAALEAYDVVHKGIGFVRFPDGLYLFNSQRHYRILLGNSISARVAVCPIFGEQSRGEEVLFTDTARRRALRELLLPPFGLVYNRTQPGHGHVYNVSPVQFLRSHGPAAFLGNLPDEVVDLREPPTVEDIFTDLEHQLTSS